jgi:hypothetical protein
MKPRDAAFFQTGSDAANHGIVQRVEARYAPPGLNLFAGQRCVDLKMLSRSAFREECSWAAQRTTEASWPTEGSFLLGNAIGEPFNSRIPLNSPRTALTS